MRLIKKIKNWLENERRYHKKPYQRLMSGLCGWSITIILTIIMLLKHYVFN